MDDSSGSPIAELGEIEVLRRVLGLLGDADAALVGPGDDCAVLHAQGDTVVTSDMMIEGPDFRTAWHSGYELGKKLVATNFSDVAAMGARPTALTFAFACPGHTPVEVLEDIARGLNAACAELSPGSGVVGGDLSRAPVMTASITAFGDLEGRPAVLRSGAKPGDTVAYAGDLGLAGIGLALLFARSADSDGRADSSGVATLRAEHPAALAAQLTPTAPVALGVVAAEAGATAMLDVSDGLSIDAARLARASGVTLRLDPHLLLTHFGEQRGETVSLEAMLHGGEDHGLLATFSADASLPPGFHMIGTVLARDDTGAEHAASEHASSEHAASERASSVLLLGDDPCRIAGWDPFTVRPPGS